MGNILGRIFGWKKVIYIRTVTNRQKETKYQITREIEIKLNALFVISVALIIPGFITAWRDLVQNRLTWFPLAYLIIGYLLLGIHVGITSRVSIKPWRGWEIADG